MHLTWTALRLDEPAATCPWTPAGAVFAQEGHSGPDARALPDFDGRWWTVLAAWPDEDTARASGEQLRGLGGTAWHVVLQAASFRGDALLAGGARPFAGLPEVGKARGAAVVVTLAGLGSDPARTGEFLERTVRLGDDATRAPGHRAAMLHAPVDGAALTFSAWATLRDAVTWAYHRPLHAETVRRQEEHGLLDTGGFLRCAVLASSGTLGDRPDPLDGLTGTVVTPQEVS